MLLDQGNNIYIYIYKLLNNRKLSKNTEKNCLNISHHG